VRALGRAAARCALRCAAAGDSAIGSGSESPRSDNTGVMADGGGALPAARFRAACAAFAADWDAAAAAGGGHAARGAWRWCDAPPPRWRSAAAADATGADADADAAAPPQRGWLELREHLLPAATSSSSPASSDLGISQPAPSASAKQDAIANDDDDDDESDPAALPAAAPAARWHAYTLHIVHNASYGAPGRPAGRQAAAPRVCFMHTRTRALFSRARCPAAPAQACRSCCCAAPRRAGSPSRGSACLLTWHPSQMRAHAQQRTQIMTMMVMHLQMRARQLRAARWARAGRC
jgi:hypothetical protein